MNYDNYYKNGGMTKEESVSAIALRIGAKKEAVAKFVEKHKIDTNQLNSDLKSGEVYFMDVITAIVGKPDNKYEKEIVKKYGSKMAKGGEISVYNLRKGDKVKTRKGDIETIIRKTGSGSYETIENDYSHSPESLEFLSRPSRKMAKGGELTYDDFMVGDFYFNSSEGGKFKFVGKDESGRLRFEDSKGIDRIFSPKRMSKYADGGMMAMGGRTQGYDDHEDERLGMKYGKMSGKDFVGSHDMREHSRRDDARFEERMEKGGKLYTTRMNVGRAKYVINYHDGSKTHKDGSPFYDIDIFSNRKDFDKAVKKLESEGYKYRYADGGMMADGGKVSYDIEYRDEEGDTYEASFDTLKDAKEEIRKIREEGGRITETWKYVDGKFSGRFKHGGMMADGGEVYYVRDFYPNYDEDKIASILKSIGAKKVRKAKLYGYSNQPDVVVFEGDKNKAQEILEKEFPDNYISIYEKDWGRKMADGGEVKNAEWSVTIESEDGETYDWVGFAKNEDEALYKTEKEAGFESVSSGIGMITDEDGNKIEYKHGGMMADGGEVEVPFNKMSDQKLLELYDDLLFGKPIRPIPMTLVNEIKKRGLYQTTSSKMGLFDAHADEYARGGMMAKGGRTKGDVGKSGTQYGYTLKEYDEIGEKNGLFVSPKEWWSSREGKKYTDSFGRTQTIGNHSQDERQEMNSYGYRIAIGMDLGSNKIPASARKYVEENNLMKTKGGMMSDGGMLYKNWDMQNGEVTYKGKSVTPYYYDRDVDVFFLDIVKGGRGYAIGFKEKKDAYDYLNEHKNLWKYANGGMMADGGEIVDQYEGRTPEDIWNNLTKLQRQHFLFDHKKIIEIYRGQKLSNLDIRDAVRTDWDGLDELLKIEFEYHTSLGQYAKGGMMADGGEIVKLESVGTAINTKTKITYPILSSGEVDLDDDGVHLSQVTDEWTQNLSKKDRDVVNSIKKYAKGGEVGDFFYDSRKDKAFQVIFEDGDKMGLQYLGMDKKPVGGVTTITKNEFEYNVEKGSWGKWKQEYAKGGMMADGGEVKDLNYNDIFDVLKDKIDETVTSEISYPFENENNYEGEQVESTSRDGFIAFTDGGYEARWFEYLSSFYSSGSSLPTKALDDEKERQINYNLTSAKESFIEEYPEIVEELGEENIDYNSLYEAGYENEAEQLSESETADMDTIMCEIGAYYYTPNNSRGIDDKHTVRLFGLINLESPYHRSGNLEDRFDVDITFNSISELKNKVDKGLKEITDWYGGSMFNESTKELKIVRMAEGGEIVTFDGHKYKVKTINRYNEDGVNEPYETYMPLYYDKKEKQSLTIGKETDIPNVYNVAYEDGKNIIYSKKNIDFFIEKGIWKKMAKGGMMARGGYVTDLDEVVASSDLKEELKSKMKEGDEIVAFGYTDYGGSFGDKVAIEYFKENHPKNIVFENSAYNGQNGIVFGEVAKDFLEETEDYPLGYEDMESFYYDMQNAQEEKDFKLFLSDIKNQYTIKKDALDWLLENKSGYYSIEPNMVDFSYSELENELEEEGLIKKKKMADGGIMADGGAISKNSTYVPNRDIKDLSLVLKGELKKLKGSDIFDGVYVKNKLPRKKVEKQDVDDAQKIFDEIIKKYKNDKYYDEKDEIIYTPETIQSLLDIGLDKKDIMVLMFGYGLIEADKIKCDNEFRGYLNGLIGIGSDYKTRIIDKFFKDSKMGYFEMGLKYPSFDWQKVVDLYNINLTPKIITTENDYRKSNYEVWTGDGVAIGHQISYQNKGAELQESGEEIGVVNLKKPTKYQIEREYPAGFNGGYWGIVVKEKDDLYRIIEMLVVQKSGYLKDLEVFTNGLGGIGSEDVFGEFAKGGETKNKWEYTDKDEIEYVVVKDKSGKELKFDGKYVISGVHDLLEKGGKLTEIGKYYSKNDVVSVLVNGKNILDKNTVSGVWIDKNAKPMAEDVADMKIGQTTVRKGYNGWVGKTMVDNFKGYDWDITTIKNSRGDLTTTAQGGKSEDKGGYKMFSFMLFQDPSIRLQTSRPARVNEKAVSEQHTEALKQFKEKVGEIQDKQKMADGGSIGFDALAKKVADNYEGDKVKKEFQDEYGKTYDKKEAEEVGKKVAGKVYRQQQAKGKMAKGGKVDKKTGTNLNRSQSKMTLISRKASEIRKANEPWRDAFNRAKAMLYS